MPQDAAPDASLVAHLQDEVTFLRGELEARTEELRRKDHLLAAALERIPELPATIEDVPQDAHTGTLRDDDPARVQNPTGGAGHAGASLAALVAENDQGWLSLKRSAAIHQ